MSFVDLAVVAVTVSAVIGGYRLGLITGLTAWVLLVQGLVAATVLLPGLDRELKDLSPGFALGLEMTAFFACGYLGVYAGRWMGARFRAELLDPQYERTDRIAGAVVAPVAVVVFLWLLVIPALSQTGGWLSGQTRHSAVARAIDEVLPTPPDTSRAFHRLIGPAGTPQVFASLDPFLDDVNPPASTGLSDEVIARVSASIVKVEGEACGRNLEGSGFTVEPGLVVTNAHVVAGQAETFVIRPDGERFAAGVVSFDPDRDLALLRVEDLGQEPLPIDDPETRETAAVFGHPDGQDSLEVSPALIRRQIPARGADLYYERSIRRQVLVLAAELRPGDSGGPLVDPEGTVVGVAFATSLDRGDTAYALSVEELRPVLETAGEAATDTGDCLR